MEDSIQEIPAIIPLHISRILSNFETLILNLQLSLRLLILN